MQIGSKVVCVYAGDCLNVETHGTYIITALHDEAGFELNIDVSTLDGKPCGTYNHKRFMLQDEMIKQVLENAKHG